MNVDLRARILVKMLVVLAHFDDPKGIVLVRLARLIRLHHEPRKLLFQLA